MKTLLIGQVAKRAGVGLGAIRLYERRKLIPSPPRGRSGYRLYPEDTVMRVQVIAAAKRLGFTLREMGGMFASLGAKGMSNLDRDTILDAKIKEIEQRRRVLEHMRDLLVQMRAKNKDSSDHAECALAEAAMRLVTESKNSLQSSPKSSPATPSRRRSR